MHGHLSSIYLNPAFQMYKITTSGQKYDSITDIQLVIDELKLVDPLTSLSLSGNSYGTSVCQELSIILKDRSTLQVRGRVFF